MSENTTDWLTERGRKRDLTLELARELAAETQTGWYIAPYSHDRVIVGRMTLTRLSSRHIVVDDKGNALTFGTIEDAKGFLRDELKIFSPQVFDY